MGLLQQIRNWGSSHHPRWLVVVRVVLGVALFVKGFQFIQNEALLPGLIAEASYFKDATWLSSVIPWIHLLGGSFLVAGLLTRLSALVQIPILIGAVFFVNMKHGLYGGSELLFSIIVLVLLIVFVIEGSGPYSLDSHMFPTSKKGSPEKNMP